jgi:hypothetical protein
MHMAATAHCSICNSLRPSLLYQPNESAIERELLLKTATMSSVAQPSTH